MSPLHSKKSFFPPSIGFSIWIKRNQIALITFTVLAIVFLIHLSLDWPFLKWSGFSGPLFGDLFVVLAQADCMENQLQILSDYREAAFECKYVYSNFLLQILTLVPFSKSVLYTLGVVTIIFILWELSKPVALIFQRDGFMSLVWNILVVSSPPMILLVNRGNLDLFVFALFLVLAKLLDNRRHAIATLLILLGTILKFYPVTAMAIIVMKKDVSKKFVYLLLMMLATYLVLAEYSEIRDFAPQPIGAAFGLRIVVEKLSSNFDLGLDYTTILILSSFVHLFFFCGAALVLKRMKHMSNFSRSKVDHVTFSNLFLISGILLVSMYFTTTNYDYRLIWLIPIFFGLQLGCSAKTFLRPMLVATFLFVMWFSYSSMHLEILGDIALITVVSWTLLVLRFWSKPFWMELIKPHRRRRPKV